MSAEGRAFNTNTPFSHFRSAFSVQEGADRKSRWGSEVFMAYSMRSDLYACPVDAGYVLLDLATSRYSLLSDEGANSLSNFYEGKALPAEICWLIRANLLVKGPDKDRPFYATTPRATQSFLDFPRVQTCFLSTLKVIVGQFKAKQDLRTWSLARILSPLTSGDDRDSLDAETVGLIAAYAFERSRRYLSSIDQCLPRGIAMKRYLNRNGCPAQLVIGINMPFSAHCWVQINDILLSDRLDLIAGYEPILVVP